MKTAHWPWLVARTPILQAPSVDLCLGPQHIFDSGYTVFGQTIEGKDVIGELRGAMSLKLSKSKTPTSHKLSRVFKEDRNSWTTNT